MEPLFLPGGRDRLFALYYAPRRADNRGTVLFVQPFAEELNKARAMVAGQARLLAEQGYGVLVPDLYGCGDSPGQFHQARWEIWREDLLACLDWLKSRAPGPPILWGLRLGALLALEVARLRPAARLLLWQPVSDGRSLLNQFLRLRTATAALAGRRERVEQLRHCLLQGQSLEVAGYRLHPELALALDRLQLPKPPAVPVDWLELAPSGEIPPARRSLIEGWPTAQGPVTVHSLPGVPFWSTQEITRAPAWLEATGAILAAP
ncbi:MAG: hydrolase 2, exosortase A system-associated [Candidatus Competibacteraceae bacterium]|nr:hydrolase 2, exosortase A system-associated [Candidatus Competibacteraceae bacterium]